MVSPIYQDVISLMLTDTDMKLQQS